MLNFICEVIEKLVFSEINGTILILPLIVLIYFLIGQAKDCSEIVTKILREGD